MAKNKFAGNVSAGLFTQAAEEAITTPAPAKEAPENAPQQPSPAPAPAVDTPAAPTRAGRPKAADIRNGVELVKASYYITEQQQELLAIYAIKNKMDKSAVIRQLIDTLVLPE